MNKSLIIVLTVCLCFGCQKEPKQLLGEWTSRDPFPGAVTWSIGRSEIEIVAFNTTQTCTYVIDSAKQPMHVDLNFKGEKISKCIIEVLDKDTFRIAGEDNPGKERPLTFNTNDPHAELFVFERKDHANQAPEDTARKLADPQR